MLRFMSWHQQFGPACTLPQHQVSSHVVAGPVSAERISLADACRRQHPRMSQQIQVMLVELERLAILPEEAWHAQLQELQVAPTHATRKNLRALAAVMQMPAMSQMLRAKIGPKMHKSTTQTTALLYLAVWQAETACMRGRRY